MQSLELKVPPPLIACAFAFAMWACCWVFPSVDLSNITRISLALILAMAGGGLAVAGAMSFRMARTSVNPMRPESASALVTTGIYQFTRNPMYLGLVLALLAWAIYLSSPDELVGPILFLFYIDRMQIRPEERVLAEKFGAEYHDYTARVRRWL